ncbi:uncharacterized protein LOC119725894 isoform X2 [Patiria miniata]|uniref:Uncharacterized protein n=1 Tax=Patiria miniata TaxID=46514 RepID=A0A913ZNV6_PATMI|nr:uncharacterized protein LOC119725894 isoform X2 [Patiria miniata]
MVWKIALFLTWTSVSLFFATTWARDPCTGPGYFACGDGSCIPRELVCSGYSECLNRADETDCEILHWCGEDFPCRYSMFDPCIDYGARCSGTAECQDASDELGCGPPYFCRADQFFCPSDYTCRDFTELCDGVNDCPGFDESFCHRVCGEEEYPLPFNEIVYVDHFTNDRFLSGFYQCSWYVVAEVHAYIFIEVLHLQIPSFGKFRLSAGVGSDPTVTETVLFSTDVSTVDMGKIYVGSQTTRAWVLMRSSRIRGDEQFEPQVALKIYQHQERLCPAGFTSCSNETDVTVCITESALCDAQFDCPDFWDESRCDVKRNELCGVRQLLSLDPVGRREFQIHAAYDPWAISTDCLWFVDVPPESRVEIIIHTFPGNDALLMFGTTHENHTVDQSATFLVVSREKWVMPSVYTPIAGEPLWITAHLISSLFVQNEMGLAAFTLRTFMEIECGSDEFACYGSELCLPLSQRCDGIPQCPSLSDERGCNECEPHVFTCDVHKCVEEKLLCDGLAQCQDMTDEYLCGHCVTTPAIDLSDGDIHQLSWMPASRHPGDCLFFLTASADHQISVRLRRIPQFSLDYPNLELAMGNGHNISDQSTRLFNVGFLLENSYREVVTSSGPLMWIKYKFADYANDQVDVFNSESILLEMSQIRQDACTDNDHACAPGECISQQHVCNGYVDCLDYSDEIGCGNCTSNEFLCLSGDRCIHETSLCDHVSHCSDGSDVDACGPCGRSLIDLSYREANSAQSRILTSPGYPQPYPQSLSCSWLVKAPDGHRALAKIEAFQMSTDYDTVTFGWGIDPTDVNSRIGSELMGQDLGLASVASRDKHLWIKFTSGLSPSTYSGFSIRIEAQETDICGKRKMHLGENIPHTLTSPNYPNDYPNDVNCVWEFQASREFSAIVVTILDFQTESKYDKVRIGGPGLYLGDIAEGSTNSIIITGTTHITTVTSQISTVNVTLTTDWSITKKGFQMTVEAFKYFPLGDCSGDLDLLCENTTICIAPDGVCNGFKDCAFGFDEQQCYTIDCSGFFQCSRSRECILWDKVCDGTDDCLLGDDEIRCDVNRCPSGCKCYYKDNALYVICQSGWSTDTLGNMAATTEVLELSSGFINVLEPGLFKRFFKLQALYLTDNHIQRIPHWSFDGLQNLLWLNISLNDFTTLESNAFQGLHKLQGIVISHVPLLTIEESAFNGLQELRTLVLIRGRFAHAQDEPVNIHPSAVLDLTNLQTLYLDDHRLCCEFRKRETFDVDNCFTTEQQSPLFNCGSLMQNTFLRVSMWFLGLSAVIGNLGVVVWRSWTSVNGNLGHGTKYVNNFLILNLAVSDFLMGIYMVIIAAADVSFGEAYYMVASEWRLSVVCKLAGVMSVLSSEASVFFITLISLDRILCIGFPHGRVRLAKSKARRAALIIWVVAFVLSSLPTILIGSDTNSDIYGLSDVCIGLPLITKPASYALKEDDIGNPLGSQSFKIPIPQDHRPAWVYSIVLFLGVNLLCFLTVALCYVFIFIKVRDSYQRVRGSRSRGSTVHQADRKEINMALRMAVIVGTDFCCWMPVIVMGLLSQSGAVTIQPHMYAWTVVFILPINSSLNPYLYTIFSVVSIRCSTNGSSSTKTTSALRTKGKNKNQVADTVVACKCAHSCPESETHL